MKKILIIIPLFFLLIACSKEDINYVTVKGKVVRELTAEGIPNQKIRLEIKNGEGTGIFYNAVTIDSKEIVTNANGDFTATMKVGDNSFIVANKFQDEFYPAHLSSFFIGSDVVITLNKFLKLKVFVSNTAAVDENDKINISLVADYKQAFVTNIENFGVPNIYSPPEGLPGQGQIGGTEETAWVGTNVNSVVHYIMEEDVEDLRLFWNKSKNGIQTNGFTETIPLQIDQINEYHFEY